jgi:diguanylate cyclase (GGDEF)-like protein
MSSVTPLTNNIPGLPERWASCSEGRDGARHVQTDEALALARAVEISLERNRATADLTRTAREWGAGLPSPSAVVSAVAALREAVTSMHAPGEESVVPASVLKVLDKVLSEAIEGVSSSLREAALIDPLTGCANRRALREDLERAVAGARRTGLDVAVAVIDLDGLKKINDTHGHAAGDATLQDLSRSLRSAVRDTDAVYRVGGDEFVVLIPFSGTGGAAAAMQRAKAEGAPTFSWGAASLSMLPAGCAVDELIELADSALYATRRNVRPITSARPRRHRAAIAGAAAAAVVGLGVSSAFVLPSSPEHAAIGAQVPGSVHGGGGHPSRSYARTSVPSPSKSNSPALHRATGAGEQSGSLSDSDSQIGEVPAEQQAVLTVATVTDSTPSGGTTTTTPPPPKKTHPGSSSKGAPGGGQSGTPPPPGKRTPHPPHIVKKPAPGPLPWRHHPGHAGGSGPHGHGRAGEHGHGRAGEHGHGRQGDGHQRGHGEQGQTRARGDAGIRKGLMSGVRALSSRLRLLV